MSTRLVDLAKVVRSKNSGPFVTTYDIVLRDAPAYQRVRSLPLWSDTAALCELLGVEVERFMSLVFFEPGLAVKINVKRRVPAGDPGDTDVYGCQQHGGLLELELGP